MTRCACLSLLLILGCTRGGDARLSEEISSDSGGGSPSDTGAPPADTGADTATESIDDAPDPSAWLFGTDQVVQVEIALDATAVDALAVDPYEWVEGDITIEGERVETVGIRLKGRIGSFRDLSGKAAFRVDFNRYVEGRRWNGLEGMTLNNMVNDYAQLHEITAYPFYEHMGVPAPRVGYAWVRVNGEDYGLYANIETPDDRWLDRVYEDPSGNLYEATYFWFGGSSYILVDFDFDTYTGFDLDEGEDVGREDILAVVEAIQSTKGTEAYYDTVGEVFDWDHYFRHWATEIWVGQWDGYDYNSNNYKIYFNPETGLGELLPWGHDWCFTDWATWTSPATVIGTSCLDHDTCRAAFLEVLGDVLDQAEDWPWRERIDEAAALIDPYVQADPRKELSYSYILSYQEDLRSWVEDRSEALRGQFGMTGPEVSVDEVAQGEVSLLEEGADLDTSGTVARAWNLGGDDVEVEGITFTARTGDDYAYTDNTPDFDGDPDTWTGLETLAYTCSYQYPGAPLSYTIAVEPGTPCTLQLVFFEVYYDTAGNRLLHVQVEGETVVRDLDSSTGSMEAGVLYRGTFTAEDGTLDVKIRGSENGDGYAILNGLLVTCES